MVILYHKVRKQSYVCQVCEKAKKVFELAGLSRDSNIGEHDNDGIQCWKSANGEECRRRHPV